MKEIWAEIEDYPGYLVSNYGEVYSEKSERKLTRRATTSGHLRVSLYQDGKAKEVYVNHLVAQTFLPDYRRGFQIRHLNGDLEDCSAWNLRQKIEREVTLPDEDRVWGRKVQIIETGAVFMSVRAAAQFIHGDYSHIYACLKGKRERHLGYTFRYVENEE